MHEVRFAGRPGLPTVMQSGEQISATDQINIGPRPIFLNCLDYVLYPNHVFCDLDALRKQKTKGDAQIIVIEHHLS
jgi:hypothetical protein